MSDLSNRSESFRQIQCAVTKIHVLPSKSSIGYVASIYAKIERGEPDGWYPEAYGYIRGLARFPESVIGQENREWQQIVVRRLRRQGVRFLTTDAADNYENRWGRLWSFCWQNPILRDVVSHL